LTHLDKDFKVLDFIVVAKEMSQFLKQQNCDYIIALTHMREDKDRELAEKCAGDIDLILGGHDHMQLFEEYDDGRPPIVKSGSDFKEFSSLKINLSTRKVSHTRVVVYEEYEIDGEKQKKTYYEYDKEADEYIAK